MGSSTFEKRYGNLFKSVERRNAELTAKAEERRKREEARIEVYRKKLEAEERRKKEMRIVESDERLRDYQQKAVKDILSAWHKMKNVMLQMPTGTGKTRLFVALINALNTTEAENYKVKGVPRFLIITHREELVEQISETLNNHYHLEHTILGKASPQPSPMERELHAAQDAKGSEELKVKSEEFNSSAYNISVSSIQYLSRQLKTSEERGVKSAELKRFDFIIIDEAHHSLADSYIRLWKAYSKAYKLGVTATPYRMKGEGFTSLYDTLIMNQTMSKYIEQGYLADYRYFTVSSTQSALQKVNRLTRMSVGGDYQIKDLQEIYANSEEIHFLYKCYAEYANGKRGIIYAVNQLHAEMIAKYFAERGVSIANIDSRTASKRRKELIAQFRNGDLQVLVNVELFGEGFDCPAIEFAMLARPTKSLAMYLQQVGRTLRPMKASPYPSPKERECHAAKDAEGSEERRVMSEKSNFDASQSDGKVIILDCVGLYNRFGLPDKEWDWEYFYMGYCYGNYRRLSHLGLDSDDGGMTEIDTPRVAAKKKEEHDKLEVTLKVFCIDNGLCGIENMLGVVVVKPCCKELTKAVGGWFYGKDKDNNLLIYDKKGTLVFRRERCDIEVDDEGTFYIRMLTIDNTTVRIGPFGRNMTVWDKWMDIWKILVCDRSLSFMNKYEKIYVLKGSGVVMTSYKLTLTTQFFRRQSKYLNDTVLIGFDSKVYKFSTMGTLYPIKLPEKELERLLSD